MKNLAEILNSWAGRNGSRPQQCVIVAEVAQAHDGSLGIAHAFIDAIARAGADAVKFQTHIAEAESTPDEPWRVRFSAQDESRYAYWKRMEFTEDQWRGLKKHAADRELLFLSSPFSLEAIDLLKRVGVAGWKAASGEISSSKMFERMADTGLPMLLSTGMSSWSEIDDAVDKVKQRQLPLAVMQCTTAYPCPPQNVGLNLISEFRERYQCAIGLSDHSGTIYPGLAAAAMGLAVLEVHVTLSREMFGPDVPASVTTTELAQLIEGIRFIELMRAHPVDKNRVAEEMKTNRRIFGKSIVARENLAAGTVLREEHLALKKPGFGMSEAQLPLVLNRKLKTAVARDRAILEEQLE